MTGTRAILFDVGGPLDTEVFHEQLVDRDIRAALMSVGVEVSDGALKRAEEQAVACFAPNAYAAMVWTLTAGNRDVALTAWRYVAERSGARRQERDGFEPRQGMRELLAALHDKGFKLGLAANQYVEAIAELDRFGMGRFFAHREVSGVHGYRKPDVRLFLRACVDLDVTPEQCVMVGDRIDNDIAPARLLGMRTVLFRTGRHRHQQPRSWDEEPDETVYTVDELAHALASLGNP